MNVIIASPRTWQEYSIDIVDWLNKNKTRAKYRRYTKDTVEDPGILKTADIIFVIATGDEQKLIEYIKNIKCKKILWFAEQLYDISLAKIDFTLDRLLNRWKILKSYIDLFDLIYVIDRNSEQFLIDSKYKNIKILEPFFLQFTRYPIYLQNMTYYK